MHGNAQHAATIAGARWVRSSSLSSDRDPEHAAPAIKRSFEGNLRLWRRIHLRRLLQPAKLNSVTATAAAAATAPTAAAAAAATTATAAQQAAAANDAPHPRQCLAASTAAAAAAPATFVVTSTNSIAAAGAQPPSYPCVRRHPPVPARRGLQQLLLQLRLRPGTLCLLAMT